MTPLKAEYIGADQLPFFLFRLQLCGGPYIPIRGRHVYHDIAHSKPIIARVSVGHTEASRRNISNSDPDHIFHRENTLQKSR